MPHGRTLEDAQQRLETVVQRAATQFAAVIHRVDWAADRARVALTGAGMRIEMWVDARNVHAVGDIPGLGALLSGPIAAGLEQLIQQTFLKRLP